jgi:L,D-peptidoglycan transpeptidase YkuD (ErfK/YbiS/YcfS/YnhG family)
VQDNDSAFYNTYRAQSLGGFAATTAGVNGSELLTDFRGQYAHAIVIDFNRPPDVQRRYRGSGIFLHVNGAGATAGCVSIPQPAVATVLSYLRPGDQITIVP